MSIPIWMDCDTGADDAIALYAAAMLSNDGVFDIKGISAVCGNVGLEHTFPNTRNVLSLAGREDISVYPGADRPLMKELHTATHVHGESGLGKAELPISNAPVETKKAWDALYEAAVACGGELQLILTGPQTNAALALKKYPDLKTRLKRVLIMGGAEIGGNVTPAAEFNIWADPNAAQIVFRSGMDIVMCGLDVTLKAGLTQAEADELDSRTEKGCKLFSDVMGLVRKLYFTEADSICAVHDVCPVFYAAYPDMFTGEKAGVFVETRGTITTGKTVSDRITDVKFPMRNTTVVYDADREAFAEKLIGLLKR